MNSKIVGINFADESFYFSQKLNKISGLLVGNVNEFISYRPEDIDRYFLKENCRFFSQNNRGFGLWLWKPYFINKTLSTLNYGEYLVYSDSGSIFLKSIKSIINKMKINNDDILLTQIPLFEIQYTSDCVFNFFNANDLKWTNQLQAGFIIIKKTNFSEYIIKEWLNSCLNYDLLSGNISSSEANIFISHREDQSILSIIAKKNSLKFYSDITDYQLNPERYLSNNKQFFKLPEIDSNRVLESPYFLLYRRSNIVLYFLKYIIRRCINLF